MLIKSEYQRISTLAKNSEDLMNQYISDVQYTLINITNKLANTDFSGEQITALLDQYRYAMYPLNPFIYFITNDMEVLGSSDSYSISDYMANQIYTLTTQSNQNLYSMGPYFTQQDSFILSFAMKSTKGTAVQGVIGANIALSEFNKILENRNVNHNISMLLLNENNQPLLSDIKIPYSLYSDMYRELIRNLPSYGNVSTSLRVDGSGEEYLLDIRTIKSMNWKLIFFANKNQIDSPIRKLQSYTLYFIIIFFIVVSLTSFFLASYVDKPIRSIINQMKKIKSTGLNLRIKLKNKDEFAVLAESFNSMFERIERLVEEKEHFQAMKKEYEFMALQAQINPHFLYNTLNSINSLVDLKRTEEIPLVLNSLVQLLQHTMGKDGEFISIGREIEALKHYIRLQSVRYRDKFSVEFDIDPSLLDYTIIKLTLQPIVENAIFHGIKSRSRTKSVIRIGAEMNADNSSIVMYVEDNGIGISEEKMAHLLENNTSKFKHYNSMGLYNVNERIKLHFGENFGLRISSAVGKGTHVEIHLPALTDAFRNNNAAGGGNRYE